MIDELRPPTVLLVGDAGSPLSTLDAALRTNFVEGHFLAQPRRVVATAASETPDLVVVDAGVQNVSWWAALAALQREPQTSAMPVAIYSAASEFDFVPPIILGACDVLEGTDVASLASRISFLLGEVSLRPPTAGGEPGADAVSRLVAYAERVGLAGGLYLIARGPGEPDGFALFEGGRLGSCSFARLQGEAALAAMLGLRAGSYYFQRAAAPAPASPPRGNSVPAPGEFLEGLEFLEPLLEDGGDEESSRPTRIVCVDDDPDQLELILFHLRERGFECWTAADGAQGLQAVLDVRPDVVVSDLQMPVLDGWGLLRGIRADHRIADTPVLVLSAAEDFRESLRAASAGAQEYLSKTGFQKHLIDGVRGALCHRWQLETSVVSSGRGKARVELVGARSTLIRMSEVVREGRVIAHDGWSGRLVVSFAAGNIVSAHGGSLSGEAALAAFLGMRRGDLSVEPGVEGAANLSGPLGASIEAAALRNNAAEASVLDATLAAGVLGLDTAMFGFYKRYGPPDGKQIAEEIARGVSPRELLSRTDRNRAHVEEIVRDLVRRRVVVFRPTG